MHEFCILVGLLVYWSNFVAIFLSLYLQYSKKSSTFAVDLVKRYQSIHILLTALAIISRIPKTLQDLTEIARNNDKGIPADVFFLSYITMLTRTVWVLREEKVSLQGYLGMR